MSAIAVSRPIRATCSHVSLWAADLLTAANFDARVVGVLTLDTWNATDNGHTLIEVRENGRWVAYDVDRKVRWTDGAVAFWDNRCVKHLAIKDSGPFRRIMRRVQIAGDKPV